MIWTVSTVGLRIRNKRVSPRTWGYYLSREEAIGGMYRCVDTEAGYYTHAVIEPFLPGVMALCDEKDQMWFEWQERWTSCPKPESERGIVNYGMG